MTDPIRVVVAADSRYLIALAACVRSIIDSSKDDDLELVVLTSELLDRDLHKLRRSWFPLGDRVQFIDIDPALFSTLPAPRGPSGYISQTTYSRLLLPRLLPESWKRALYIDVDTLTLSSLKGLWETFLNGAPLAAALDCDNPLISSSNGVRRWYDAGLDPNAHYFNAGVLLIDMDEWRNTSICERAWDYLVKYADDVMWLDQEGLNAATNGDFVVLDPSWNFQTYWNQHPEANRESRTGVEHDVKIRHFNGAEYKPWNPGNRQAGVGTEQFFLYLDRTAWNGWRPDIGEQDFNASA